MTLWSVDIMWAMMLLGVALFTACMVVVNPVLKSVRVMGLVTAYAIAVYMAVALPWLVAVTTWCIFAACGGVVAFAYELWARRHYAGTDRPPRPLVALQGFILWPTMIPDAIEGVLVDVGVLSAGSASSERAKRDARLKAADDGTPAPPVQAPRALR
jgi:hypothetical protein